MFFSALKISLFLSHWLRHKFSSFSRVYQSSKFLGPVHNQNLDCSVVPTNVRNPQLGPGKIEPTLIVQLLAHMFADSPSNISHNPSEVISEFPTLGQLLKIPTICPPNCAGWPPNFVGAESIYILLHRAFGQVLELIIFWKCYAQFQNPSNILMWE